MLTVRLTRAASCLTASAVVLVAFMTSVATYTMPSGVTADTVFVSNTATSCPGSGTSGSPYCSIGYALNAMGSSNKHDRVLAVMGTGVPYVEQITFSGSHQDSGTVAHPFVFLAYGDNVTIDGADAATNWTHVGSVWRTHVYGHVKPPQLFINGVRYPQVDSASVLSGRPKITPWFYGARGPTV